MVFIYDGDKAMMQETVNYDVRDFTRENAGDERLGVRFFNKPVEIHEKSIEAGRPIFETMEYIHIMVPGDRDNQIVRPVRPGDKLRFKNAYEHFKSATGDEAITGTMLEAWGRLTLAQVEEYRYFGVRTVEALATLRDDVVMKMPGAHDLKRQAQRFLEAAAAEAPMKAMQEQLSQRDEQINTLNGQMAQMIAEMKAMREDNAKGSRRNAG